MSHSDKYNKVTQKNWENAGQTYGGKDYFSSSSQGKQCNDEKEATMKKSRRMFQAEYIYKAFKTLKQK